MASHDTRAPRQLTAGQEAVRQHTLTLLAEHGSLTPEAKYIAARDLPSRLAADPVVRNDKLTGKSLATRAYATGYLDWLAQRSPKKKLTPPFPSLPIEQFQYGRQDVSDVPAYSGGIKPETVAQVLLAIAGEEPIEDGGWGIAIYEGADVVTTLGGGEHRTLACSLWGFDQPSPQEMKVYQASQHVDSDLNRALLRFEQACGGPYHLESERESDAVKELGLFGTDADFEEIRRRGKRALPERLARGAFRRSILAWWRRR